MKKALVVGINNYPQCPLYGCENDANAVENILSRNADSSANFSVKKELNVPTKGELKRHIVDCFSGNNEIALFYFSGHGYIDAIGGYIVTPDYSQHDMGVSMQEILTIVNDSRTKNKIIILDCCHAGFLGSISTTGQQASIIGDGVTLLTASKSDEPAMEVHGHGVFTSLLLDALNGGAADVTGFITPGGIYAYIDKALGPWEQRPVFKTNVTRFSPLRRAIPQIREDVLRRLVNYFATPDAELPLNPSFEPTNAPAVEHKVVKPYADAENTKIFKELQMLEGVGLVIPCGEEHMYFAAMNSKSCRLTSAGQHYWRLVHENII